MSIATIWLKRYSSVPTVNLNLRGLLEYLAQDEQFFVMSSNIVRGSGSFGLALRSRLDKALAGRVSE